MKKAVILFSIGLVLLVGLAVLASFVLASKPGLVQASVTPSKNNIYVVIPENVVEIAPGVFSLGTAIDSDGSVVEGYAIVHYKDKDKNAKPGFVGSSARTACYGFLASGARWRVTESYSINPSNTQGLSESFVVSSTSAGDSQWDNQVTFDIFGTDSVSYSASYNNGALDDVNTLSFGDISETGVIGVTNIWGVFGGS